MIYELAKQLEQAGFPQDVRIDISGTDGPFFGSFYYIVERDLEREGGGEVAPSFLNERQVREYSDSDNYLVKIPTLSELIEACGEGFETLSRDTSTETTCWIANNYHEPGAPEEKVLGWYEGPTPEEAVARLWLALQK